MITAACSGGWLVTGINSIILNVWGVTDSKPIVASNQFAFSIGSILAPVLVGLYIHEGMTPPMHTPSYDSLFYLIFR